MKTRAMKTRKPYWLDEFQAVIATDSDDETSRQFKEYQKIPAVAELLNTLCVRFEPVQSFRPRLPTNVIQGFEVLGMDQTGRPYGAVLAEAQRLSIRDIDLDLILLMLALRTVRRLRTILHEQIGSETNNLWFSVNLNARMLNAHCLRPIMDRYYVRESDWLPFELSESFPEGLSEESSPARRVHILRDAREQLQRLKRTYGFALVLDDNNEMEAGVRAELGELAIKTKADSRFTRDLFSLGSTSEASGIIEGLANCRWRGKPLVVEGVELPEQYTMLREEWPDDDGETSMQGYVIRLQEPLSRFFDPMSAVSRQLPKGYRLKEKVRRHMEAA